jgi:hypothetical protein
MTIVSTWMLALFISSPNSGTGGGPMVIENLASQEECLRIQQVFERQMRVNRSVCVEVRKAKQ